MSDAPQGSGRNDRASGSAPWERSQDWSAEPSEPTRVDELLSRLSADDEVGRRSRRRAAGDAEQTVAASDLIAALQTQAGSGPKAETTAGESPTTHPDADATLLIAHPVATGVPSGPAAADAEATVSAARPGDEATVLLPRYSEDPAAILDSLRRQSGSDQPPVDPPAGPPTGTGGSGGDGNGQHRRSRGWLYAGRSAIAAIAAGLMLFTGMEYSVLQTTNAALQEKQVDALQTDDTHIKTPTATGTRKAAGTNAAGETTAAQEVYPAENILLLGSDTRANGNAGPGVGSESETDSAQSDTLLVAHISADRQHITIVSVPRDLHVAAPTCKTWDYKTGKLSDQDYPVSDGDQWKITNAYAVGGPKCTVKAVQQLTGLRIDRVIGIDFAGFKTMVDALGGIKVNVCKPLVDNELGTVIPKAGEQTLVGDQALSFVRARKVEGDPTGDLGRIRRQQVVLSAMLRQVVSAGTLLNPTKLERFLDAFVDSTYTANVTVDSLIDLAKSFGSLDPQKVTFYTLPTVTDPNDPDALALDPKATAVFDALVNDQTLPGEPTVPTTSSKTKSTATKSSASTTKKSATPTLTVAPADVDLEVVNVAGRAGVAGEAQTALNALGFDISDDDLTLPDDQPVYTDITVLYAPENKAAALTVAAAVPGAILEAQDGLGSRVRLLLGTSYTGTVTAVKAGDPVPTSLRSAVSATGSTATSTTSAADAGSSSTGTAPSLASTDLSSVNAAQTGCA